MNIILFITLIVLILIFTYQQIRFFLLKENFKLELDVTWVDDKKVVDRKMNKTNKTNTLGYDFDVSNTKYNQLKEFIPDKDNYTVFKESPGYVVTNAFGHVLEEKLVAEKYLRASGLDYTIVRPGGLKADPPAGGLFISGENTLDAGEISRDLVADVCVAAISDPASKNKVVEIVETAAGTAGAPTNAWFNGLKM